MRGKIRKGGTLYFLLAEQEKSFRFAPSDILINSKNVFCDVNKMAGIKKKQTFGFRMSRKIDFITIDTDQFTSLGTGIIPFLEHDDANRALMGSNMQRQSLPLLEKEMSLLETGRESSVVRESEAVLVARNSGKVIYSSMNKIIIKEAFSYIKFANYNLFFTKFKGSRVFDNEVIFKKMKTFRTTYFLGKSKKSNHSVFLRKNPLVKKGDWVKAGQVIADNTGTLRGTLAFGKNILVGYMGWEGYNFEDAVIINERLITEDVFTSLHVKKYKTFFIVGGIKEVRIFIIGINFVYFHAINFCFWKINEEF
jgi:DNA-directed RNA polymerase subunit beta